MGHGCRSRVKITLHFDEEPGHTAILLFAHDTWRIAVERGFEMMIPKDQEEVLLEQESWLQPPALPVVASSESSWERNPRYTPEDPQLRLTSPMTHEPEKAAVGLESATCFRNRTRRNPVNPSVIIEEVEALGQATPRHLMVLQKYLHASRLSTLYWFPGGGSVDPTVGADIRDWVEVTLKDGQVLRLQHYPDLGIWKVEGEGDFQLDLSEVQRRGILAPDGWTKE